MLFYFLSSNPSVRATLTAELDSVLGPSSREAAAAIRKDPYILNALPYTTATIKETLRLFPPANTMRIGSPDVPIIDPSSGASYPTTGCVVWPDSWVIGRDARYFPEPLQFMPERWMADKSQFPLPPAGAFRAFERGPRNCIGSEFGMLEVKVVVAVTVREFEFVSGYGVNDAKVDGEPCYQVCL
jgi:cytochrome P450